MGQYYIIANMDKKEVMTLKGRLQEKKLMEMALDKTVVSGIMNLLTGKWCKDHVYLIGDYADHDNMDEAYHNVLKEWKEKYNVYGSLYKFIIDSFARIEGDPVNNHYRFIYNHSRKEYIDLHHCQKCHNDDARISEYISPLVLLIAVGNGRGGGDYFNDKNDEFAGSWCDSIHEVEIGKEFRDDLQYNEFRPDFCDDNIVYLLDNEIEVQTSMRKCW